MMPKHEELQVCPPLMAKAKTSALVSLKPYFLAFLPCRCDLSSWLKAGICNTGRAQERLGSSQTSLRHRQPWRPKQLSVPIHGELPTMSVLNKTLLSLAQPPPAALISRPSCHNNSSEKLWKWVKIWKFRRQFKFNPCQNMMDNIPEAEEVWWIKFASWKGLFHVWFNCTWTG